MADVVTWAATQGSLKIWENGQLMIVIPYTQYPALLAAVATDLRNELERKPDDKDCKA
jgi:hypothetical protein